MAITAFDLDTTAAGTSSTSAFTEQTAASLFANPALTTSGGNGGRADQITLTLSGATATESLSIAAATLTSLGMTASYNSVTGVLTITKAGGTDADWVTALKAVTYNDTSDAPSSATRTITVTATDASGRIGKATVEITAPASREALGPEEDASVGCNVASGTFGAAGALPSLAMVLLFARNNRRSRRRRVTGDLTR